MNLRLINAILASVATMTLIAVGLTDHNRLLVVVAALFIATYTIIEVREMGKR